MVRIFFHALVAGFLYLAGSVAYEAWQQRHFAQLPVTPLSEVPQHAGKRVRVQGVIGDIALPDDEKVALQVVRHRSSTHARSSTSSTRRRPDSVWPARVLISDGKAEIRVNTAGVEHEYITRSGASSAPYTPDLRLIYEGERVEVIGIVDKKDPTLIRSANRPVIISNLSNSAIAAQHARSSAITLAFATPFIMFVLGVFLWFNHGSRRKINGVAIYPLEVEATRGVTSKQDHYRKLDRLLVEAGVDPRDYHRRSKRVLRAAVGVLILPAIVFGVLVHRLDLLAGGPPVVYAKAPAATKASGTATPAATMTFMHPRFSFEHPRGWRRLPPLRNDVYATVVRTKDGILLESLEVRAYAGDPEVAAKQNAHAHSSDVKRYERTTQFAGMPATESGFEHNNVYPDGSSVRMYWKLVLIEHQDGGLAISYSGTARVPQVTSIHDVGTVGELPVLLRSFNFKSAGSLVSETRR